jgi:hypothetical protein
MISVVTSSCFSWFFQGSSGGNKMMFLLLKVRTELGSRAGCGEERILLALAVVEEKSTRHS